MHHRVVLLILVAGVVAGCQGRAEIFPNSDKNLRKTAAEFAADAAKRHPYKSDAPRGGEAIARAQYGNWMNVLEITNLSADDWTDVEVWVNKSYVVYLPQMQRGVLKRIPFQALYNDAGAHFPTSTKKDHVKTVELYRDGQMWDVKVQLAD